MGAPLVVSLTTTPARNGTVWETIASLAAQTRPPDAIHAYLTEGCDPIVHPLVRSFLVPDRGPVTKLFAVAAASLPPDALIVTVDDDQSYAPAWLGVLEACAAGGAAAVGFAGWNIGKDAIEFPGPVKGPVHVLEGWAGVAYRKRFFTVDVLEPPAALRSFDDVWISSYLQRLGIERVICGRAMTLPRKQPRALGLHDAAGFQARCFAAARAEFPTVRR